ncbi:MAG: dephospho-CoA kinase [Nitrospirota bacterium]
MSLIGLTGGIASGKSTIALLFKEAGAYVIDVDKIAHNIILPVTCVWRKIVDNFGEDILNENNTINRRKLGDIIFDDPEKREELNNIVHPAIFMEGENQRKEIIKNDPNAIIIYDAALLIETGANEFMDRIILVYTDKKTQLKRIMERDNLSRREALQRIKAQMPLDEKKRYADYLINSSRTICEIKNEVGVIYEELESID